jgi:AcrR family transcriptional regulator
MATLAPATHERDTTAPERILKAATALFAERGYHGTSMRTLARVLRVETPSLYYHFPSKQEMLVAILDHTLDDLLDGLRRAVAAVDSAEDGLRAAVRFHVQFHARRRAEAFVSHSELRSLTPANLRRVVAKRDAYEQVFRGLLGAGVRGGVFRVADVKLAAMAILSMCTGVATWFSDGGRLAPDAIADRYVSMIMRSLDRSRKGPRS